MATRGLQNRRRVTRASSKAASATATPAPVLETDILEPPPRAASRSRREGSARLEADAPNTPKIGPAPNFNYGSPDRDIPRSIVNPDAGIARVLTRSLARVRRINYDDPDDSDDGDDLMGDGSIITFPENPTPRPPPNPPSVIFSTYEPEKPIVPLYTEESSRYVEEQVRDVSPTPTFRVDDMAPELETYDDDDDHREARQWTKGMIFYALVILSIFGLGWIGSVRFMKTQDASVRDMFGRVPEGWILLPETFYAGIRRAGQDLERQGEKLERAYKALHDANRHSLNVTTLMERVRGTWEQRLEYVEAHLSVTERDIVTLKDRLHRSSIMRLEEMLPKQIVVQKGPDGELEIGPLFWTALRAKIDEEYGTAGPSGDQSNNGESRSNEPHSTPSQWQEFLVANERLLEQKLEREFTDYRKKVLRDQAILTRPEFLDVLNKRYRELSSQIVQSREQVDNQIRLLDHSISSRIYDAIMTRYNKIAKEDVLASIAPAQLEAMAHVAILANTFNALSKTNWLSPSLGAVVNPHGTSMKYIPPEPDSPRRINIFGHAIRRINMFWRGPHRSKIPNYVEPLPAVAALIPWHDLGDCWCTPASSERGARLDIHLGRAIYPSEMVVEFPPASSTPEFKTAPRTIEVWGRFVDRQAWQRTRQHFEEVHRRRSSSSSPTTNPNSDPDADDPRDPDSRGGWAPLAHFQYDVRHPNHVQTFPFPLDPAALDAQIERIRVLFLDNWGDPHRVCIYRLRLAGLEASDAMSDTNSPPDDDDEDEDEEKRSYREHHGDADERVLGDEHDGWQ